MGTFSIAKMNSWADKDARDFGTIQAMQKKHKKEVADEAAKAKEAEANSLLKKDFVTISDEAKSKLSSDTVQPEDNEMSLGVNIGKSIRDIAGEIMAGVEEGEESTIDASQSANEAEEKNEIEKEEKLQELQAVGDEGDQSQIALLEGELGMLRATHSELKTKEMDQMKQAPAESA